MTKADVISRAKVRAWEGGATVEQNTYARATDEETLRSISGNLTMTSDGTAECAYDAYRRRRR